MTLRVCAGNEAEQLAVIVVASEAQLSQVVQEEVELREPGLERALYHASEHGCCLGVR